MDFSFFRSKQPELSSSYHDTVVAELAKAKSEADLLEGVHDALKSKIDRNFKTGMADKAANLQREIANLEETGRMSRAGMEDARGRSYQQIQGSYLDLARDKALQETGDARQALARDEAARSALAALETGQGMQVAGPPSPQPPGFVGPPAPQQGPPGLGETDMLAMMPPNVQQMFLSHRQQNLDQEHANNVERQKASENAARYGADYQLKAQAQEFEQQHATMKLQADLAQKQAEFELKRPRPRDVAIERWKSLGMKPDPGDPLTGRAPQSQAEFLKVASDWIDAEERRVDGTQAQGGGSLAPGGTAPPAPDSSAQPTPPFSSTFDEMPADQFASFTAQAGAAYASGKSIQEIAQESGDPQFLQKLAASPRAIQALEAAKGAAPAAQAATPEQALDSEIKRINEEYADRLFHWQKGASAGDAATGAVPKELKRVRDADVAKLKRDYTERAAREQMPSTDPSDYINRSLPPEERFKAANAAMEKAHAEWKAKFGISSARGSAAKGGYGPLDVLRSALGGPSRPGTSINNEPKPLEPIPVGSTPLSRWLDGLPPK